MDLGQAVAKHAEWKVKFRAAITQKQQLDVAEIGRDNCCDLGKWLHGEARSKFAGLESYKSCMKSHASFHVNAGRVAQTINAGRFAEAEAMLVGQSPFALSSNEVALAIHQLKKEAAL